MAGKELLLLCHFKLEESRVQFKTLRKAHIVVTLKNQHHSVGQW